MESDVVLAHELVELDVVVVLPPLLPLISVGSCDGKVTDRGIEPNVEDLVGEFLDGNWGAPLEISGDASSEKTLLQHDLSESDRVLGPLALNFLFGNPCFKSWLNLSQINEDVLGLF